jgi:hypothetical protein
VCFLSFWVIYFMYLFSRKEGIWRAILSKFQWNAGDTRITSIRIIQMGLPGREFSWWWWWPWSWWCHPWWWWCPVWQQKSMIVRVCALLRCNKRARLRYKKRGRVGPWDKTREHTRALESHSDGKRGTNRQNYRQTERKKARNVTGPRNVTGGESLREKESTRYIPSPTYFYSWLIITTPV